MKKLVLLGLVAFILLGIAGSSQAKNLKIRIGPREIYAQPGTGFIELMYRPDAVITFRSTSYPSYSGAAGTLITYRAERYIPTVAEAMSGSAKNCWVIKNIPEYVNSGRITINYPGCETATTTLTGIDALIRAGGARLDARVIDTNRIRYCAETY